VIDIDRPVRVFRNWERGCYSIMQNGLVRASARAVRLREVEFRVREAGRRRMLDGGPRNVHAFAVGRLVDFVHPDEGRELEALGGRGVHYDPHRFGTFVDRETEDPIAGAGLVHFGEGGVTYRDGVHPRPVVTALERPAA
jgi:hypothetical protein